MDSTYTFTCYQPLWIKDNQWIRLLEKVGMLDGDNTLVSTMSNWTPLEQFQPEVGDKEWLDAFMVQPQAKYLDLQLCDMSRRRHIERLQYFTNTNTSIGELPPGFRLACEETQLQLMFVNKCVFMLVVQFKIKSTSEADLAQLHQLPLYIRRIMENNKPEGWSSEMKDSACFESRKLIEVITHRTMPQDCVYVSDNTCHIVSDFGSNTDELSIQSAQEIHAEEELDYEDVTPIDGSSNQVFSHFGWSYSTLLGLKESRAKMCLPFMLYLQSFWFLNKFFKSVLLESMNVLSRSITNDELKKRSRMFDTMVLANEWYNIRHSQYKGALKPWQTAAFEGVEQYWGLLASMEDVRRWIQTNKDFIDRKISYNIQAIEQKQSFILFVITLIQMLTIVGFFKDYFDLISYAQVPQIFGFITERHFTAFSLYLPLWLVLINCVFVLYIYRRRIGMFFGKDKGLD